MHTSFFTTELFVLTVPSLTVYTHQFITGPSNQLNVEISAAAVNEVIEFQAGAAAPDTITISFEINNDEVALEDVERYIAQLNLEGSSNAVIVEPQTTEINILDDDGTA